MMDVGMFSVVSGGSTSKTLCDLSDLWLSNDISSL